MKGISIFFLSVFLVTTTAFNQTVKCSYCKGYGKISHSDCNGTGKFKCNSCNGYGKISHSGCNGTGKFKCNNCNGYGAVLATVYNQFLGIYQQVTQPCMNCRGYGYFLCSDCNGYGYFSCSDCRGYGYFSCSDCNGNGYVNSATSFGGSNRSGKCNIKSHKCTGCVDVNKDNYCDICYANGYSCHTILH